MIWPCLFTITPLPSERSPSARVASINTSDGWMVRYTLAATAGAAVVVVGAVVVGAAVSESDDTTRSTSA